jgi:hypothetical protein
VTIDAQNGEIWGYNPCTGSTRAGASLLGCGWFYIRINRVTASSGSFSEGKIFLKNSISNQKDIGVYVGFSLQQGEHIELKAGTSSLEPGGCKRNLETEIGQQVLKPSNRIPELGRKHYRE